MKKLEYSSFQNFIKVIVTFGAVSLISQPVTAQITPDNTLSDENSEVTSISEEEQQIDGGAIRGSNLFHSFSEFNVGENQTVNFANPENIANIFSRVTGNNLSQILGDLGVLGNANLFLINPNGIVFGENASLNVNGSFVATTANSINFSDGNRFAANPATGKPLLTINLPNALEFGNEPGTITNRAQSPQKAVSNEQFNNDGNPAGLLVQPEKTLALIGGDVVFEGGNLTATGGNIEVGSVGANSSISLSLSESQITFDYQAANTFSDITLTNRDGFGLGFTFDEDGEIVFDENGRPVFTFVETPVASFLDASTSTMPGSINIRGKNINISNGSQLQTFTSFDLPGGNIRLNATEQITVDGNNVVPGDVIVPSAIASFTTSLGDAGNITVDTRTLIVREGAKIASEATATFNPITEESVPSEGNAGTIQIDAESIILSDRGEINSGTQGTGKGGEINLIAKNITLDRESAVTTSTFQAGNAGAIEVTASDSINLNNSSQISSKAGTNSTGNAGSIILQGTKIWLDNESRIDTNTGGEGDGGVIDITADDTLLLDNASVLLSQVRETAMGNAGSINITSSSVKFDNNSLAFASTQGQGNAGAINIIARNFLNLDNRSLLLAQVEEDAIGNAGAINISASNIKFDRESQALADTQGKGNAGIINITESNSLTLNRESLLITQVSENAEGNAGDIEIATSNFAITNNSFVISDSKGIGNAGNISLEVKERLVAENNSVIRSGLEENGVGRGGNITVDSPEIVFNNNSGLSSGTKGEGRGGNIEVTAESLFIDRVSFVSSSSSEGATGTGGSININTEKMSVTDESGINAFTTTNFNGGEIIINARQVALSEGGTIFAATDSLGNAGNIELNIAESLFVDGSNLSSVPEREPERNSFLNEVNGQTGIFANTSDFAEGDGGNIIIGIFLQQGNSSSLDETRYTDRITLKNNAEISVDSLGTGNGGEITIRAENLNLERSQISAITSASQPGNELPSNINLSTEKLELRDNSAISAEARNNANGGNINISAEFIITSPQDNSDIIANAEFGDGGNISIEASGIFGIDFRETTTSLSDITASSNFGTDGTVNLINSDLQSDRIELDSVQLIAEIAPSFSPDSCYVGQRNKYIQTGRGGVPLAAKSSLISEYTWEDWRIIDSEQLAETTPSRTSDVVVPENNTSVNPVRGWVVNSKGEIILTDKPLMVIPQSLTAGSPGC